MLVGEGGVNEALPPLRSKVSDRAAETANRLDTDFNIRARRLRPGQGPSGEPAMDGGITKVAGRGGLRRGRSVRGEHRSDEGERQPLPTSCIQQIFQNKLKGDVG